MCSKGFLKIQLFLRYFVEKFQNIYWEKYTFQWHLPEICTYFSKYYNNFPWQKYAKQSRCYKQRN